MTRQVIKYNPFAPPPREVDLLPPPIFPGKDPNSAMTQRMIRAKQENGPNYWTEMRAVLADDVKNLPHHRFKMWASVWHIPILSRHRYYQFFVKVLDQVTEYGLEEKLKDKGVGCLPEEFPLIAIFDDPDMPVTMNRLQMFAHLMNTGFHDQLPGFNSILELGAGIGEMTDVCFDLGFQPDSQGQYTIFDFPEVHAIQKIHHQALKLDPQRISYVDNVESLKGEYDFGIATFSLTEMPFDLREQILDTAHVKNWLIMYSSKIFGFDNDAWVKEKFLPRFTNHDITFIGAPYMPQDGGTQYLIVRERA